MRPRGWSSTIRTPRSVGRGTSARRSNGRGAAAGCRRRSCWTWPAPFTPSTSSGAGCPAGRGPSWRACGTSSSRCPPSRHRSSEASIPAGRSSTAPPSALKTARRKMRVAQERLRERLNGMLRSTDLAGAIGDAIVTQRAGRYVIPVRAEAKGRVPGIVHDQSASAATLFIEPMAVVELNNAWIGGHPRGRGRGGADPRGPVAGGRGPCRVARHLPGGAGPRRPVDGAGPPRGGHGRGPTGGDR